MPCAWNGDVYFLFKDEENPLPPSDEAERELQRKYNKYCQDLRVKVEGQSTGYVTVSEFGWKGLNLLIKEFNFQIFLCIWCTCIWMFNTKSYKLFIYFVLVEYLGEEFIDIYKKYFV